MMETDDFDHLDIILDHTLTRHRRNVRFLTQKYIYLFIIYYNYKTRGQSTQSNVFLDRKRASSLWYVRE